MKTSELSFYSVKVQFIITDDKGKDKKVTEQYLCQAVSVTDAEVITTTEFTNTVSDFKVIGVTETKIIDVLTKESVANKNN